MIFFFSSRRRHTRWTGDWSSDVCSSDLVGPGGEFGFMPIWSRLASDYLAAALPLGLQVRRCEEPRRPAPLVGDDGTDLYDGVRPPDHVPGKPPNIWSLHALAAAATNAAWQG